MLDITDARMSIVVKMQIATAKCTLVPITELSQLTITPCGLKNVLVCTFQFFFDLLRWVTHLRYHSHQEGCRKWVNLCGWTRVDSIVKDFWYDTYDMQHTSLICFLCFQQWVIRIYSMLDFWTSIHGSLFLLGQFDMCYLSTACWCRILASSVSQPWVVQMAVNGLRFRHQAGNRNQGIKLKSMKRCFCLFRVAVSKEKVSISSTVPGCHCCLLQTILAVGNGVQKLVGQWCDWAKCKYSIHFSFSRVKLSPGTLWLGAKSSKKRTKAMGRTSRRRQSKCSLTLE